MQEMKIEISYQDQKNLENICTEKGWSYSVFFNLLIENYIKFGFFDEKNQLEEQPSFKCNPKSLDVTVLDKATPVAVTPKPKNKEK